MNIIRYNRIARSLIGGIIGGFIGYVITVLILK